MEKDLVEMFNGFEQNLKDLKKSNDELKASNEELKTSNGELLVKVAALETKVAEYKPTDISGVETKIGELETGLTEAKTSVESVDTKLNGLEEFKSKFSDETITKLNEIASGTGVGSGGDKISYILPGGETMVFNSRTDVDKWAKDEAKKFLGYGKEHQGSP